MFKFSVHGFGLMVRFKDTLKCYVLGYELKQIIKAVICGKTLSFRLCVSFLYF